MGNHPRCPCLNFRKSAQVHTGLWELFCIVWRQAELDSLSRTSLFRKHNFTAILQDALEDMSSRPPVEVEGILKNVNIALDLVLDENSAVKIRPHIDQATQLLGICLTAVNEFMSKRTLANDFTSSLELDDKLTTNIARIYRSILYGDRPTKKVCLHIREGSSTRLQGYSL
jgi:hypothetical protein